MIMAKYCEECDDPAWLEDGRVLCDRCRTIMGRSCWGYADIVLTQIGRVCDLHDMPIGHRTRELIEENL